MYGNLGRRPVDPVRADGTAVIRDNPTTEQAKRFSSLYTRLLTQSVLEQKWGVLKFLLEVSGQQDGAAAAAVVATPRTPDAALLAVEREVVDEQIFSTAFSGQGLHRLPARDVPQDGGGGSLSTEPDDLLGQPTKADLLLKRGDGIGTTRSRSAVGRTGTDFEDRAERAEAIVRPSIHAFGVVFSIFALQIDAGFEICGVATSHTPAAPRLVAAQTSRAVAIVQIT